LFPLLVTVPLYWRATRPVAVTIGVVVATTGWLLTMFNLSVQPPLEPALAVIVALFTLASVTDGRRLMVGTVTANAGQYYATGLLT